MARIKVICIQSSMSLAVILTALPVEYLAVREHLTSLREVIHPQGMVYERGKFITDCQTWEVGIAEVGAGNAGAAIEAERALSYFKPDILLFAGIAGGIKDVKVGSVVAATKVYGYESGKVGEAAFLTRPAMGASTYAVVQRAKSEARKGEWVKRILNSENANPQVFVAPIAAGEKVIASRESELFQFLRASYNDEIAVEMEGFGFLRAALAYPNVQTLVIRGISDLIKDKNAVDPKEGSEEARQKRASQNASAFAFEVLAKLQAKKTPKEIDVLPHKNPSGYQEEQGVSLEDLEAFLSQENWEKADKLTLELILKNNNGDFLTAPSIRKIRSDLLKEIDSLWANSSSGRFGLKLQTQLWQDCRTPKKNIFSRMKIFGNTKDAPISKTEAWTEFGCRVGWRDEEKRNVLPDDKIDFSIKAPKGCFPQTRRWLHGGFGNTPKQFSALMERISKLESNC